MKINKFKIFFPLLLSVVYLHYPAFSQKPKLFINEIMACNYNIHKDGYNEYDDWIEILNGDTTTVDMGGMYFTDDKKKLTKYKLSLKDPSITSVQPGNYLVFWFDKQINQGTKHIDFKLNFKGEFIALVNKDGKTIIDSITYSKQRKNISYGRKREEGRGKRDSSEKFVYFSSPTPRTSNKTTGYPGICSDPLLSHFSGFYQQPFSLMVTPKEKGSEIYYNFNGIDPTEKGILYTGPLEIKKNCTVKFFVKNKALLSSEPVLKSFYINEHRNLPVFSLSVDSIYLFGQKGIYTNQVSYEVVPVALEYFDWEGKEGFEMKGDLKTTGQAIKTFPQRSLSVHTNKQLGEEFLNYRLFDVRKRKRYSGFLLRNSGNDWAYTMFKDALLQTLTLKGMNNDIQAYEPCVVYINGTYYGIHNQREKICKHYLLNRFGVEEDELDFVEVNNRALVGSDKDYDTLLEYAEKHSLKEKDHYKYVIERIDLNNFIDYQISEIYFANIDWPMANRKYWKEDKPDSKWRWILIDTDLGFTKKNGKHINSLEYASGINNYHLPHLTEPLLNSTILYRALIQNEEFKNKFIIRFADCLNSNFEPERVKNFIDSLKNQLKQEMPYHIACWKDKGGIQSMEQWGQNIRTLEIFAEERADTMRLFIQNTYKLAGTTKVALKIEDDKGNDIAGLMKLNSLTISSFPWSGVYFRNLSIKAEALDISGYTFKGWKEFPGKKREITITPEDSVVKLTAVYGR